MTARIVFCFKNTQNSRTRLSCLRRGDDFPVSNETGRTVVVIG